MPKLTAQKRQDDVTLIMKTVSAKLKEIKSDPTVDEESIEAQEAWGGGGIRLYNRNLYFHSSIYSDSFSYLKSLSDHLAR